VEHIAAIARGAEDRGIDSLWVPEPHLLVFKEYSSVFPYSADGKMPEEYGTEGELDGLLSLAYLAAVTTRIRLGIGVCVVPQGNPVYLAKAVTTLDHLSDGRFDFGVGIGWLAEEFEAVGTSFAGRADRCRAYVEVMQSLWTRPMARYESEHFTLPEARQDPQPLQRPHPPIHVGGNSQGALRRVADLGQGWIPWDLSPSQAKDGVKTLGELLAARERTRGDVQVSVALEMPSGGLDLEGYAEAGVDQLVIVAPEVNSQPEIDRMLDEFVATVHEHAETL
jgi:probable F420-dependent oxidoreductase